jgi:3'-phosphoadenosine 5'-phosphosulfate synthase
MSKDEKKYKYALAAGDEEKGVEHRTSSGPGQNDDSQERGQYFVFFCVLLAIVYVLSRTGQPASCPDGVLPDGNFDIGAYREAALAATPPNIIECAEASEGSSQEACHLPNEKRFKALGQKGITLWMTGYSGSGKSTIARALEEKLVQEYGLHVQNLDGDNVRTGLNRDLGFSPADRAESVRRVGEMACLFNAGGVITLVTLVSPYEADRNEARKRHEDQGLIFKEVFMDVPITVVQERDPKGLYAKVASGEIKSFTGMSADAPYEPPPNPEINLPNYKMTVEESVEMLMSELRKAGVLSGGPTNPMGLPMPSGYDGYFLEDELMAPVSKRASLLEEAKSLPKARLNDIDVNWLQVIGEGWASPLKGFMREGPLLQALHFNSLLIDTWDNTNARNLNEKQTDWNDYTTRAHERVSLSIPIVLPITGYTKQNIEASGKQSVALMDKDGRVLALLHNPEIYENRKEEIVTRCFGVIDMGHPYIKHIYSGGDWLLGGEIQLLQRITYNDGLDQYRLTPKEMYAEFEAKNADVVFAFQTRNPTHAGHAFLMNTGRERLQARGYKNPVLWLSPLGGWTKEDDVPLDVRVKQHVAILEEKMLDPAWTVMAIWPAPMIYGGPTEVQFHAQSRRNAGASFFVVGRDPAGMKGSELAVASPDDDLYKGEHGRYVLQMSPVLEDQQMQLISFDKFYYDITDHKMKAMDESRPNDFISISGSKMRKLAAQGATPCPDPIPNDLLTANCIPQGFMVPQGWNIVCDYYQNIDTKTWVPWSKAVVSPEVAQGTSPVGVFGDDFELLFKDKSGKYLSPWHDLPLLGTVSNSYTFVVEIPMYETAKMEVNKEDIFNPIKQDRNKDGSPRYYTYGTPFFNYGLLPQTWEDPENCDMQGHCGDNDPLDVMEIGDSPLPMGSVVDVKVLGSLELIDEGETDHKIIALRLDDKDAHLIHDMASLEYVKPGLISKLIDWLKKYKTSDGKPENFLSSDFPTSESEAINIINECHDRWINLKAGRSGTREGFYITN